MRNGYGLAVYYRQLWFRSNSQLTEIAPLWGYFDQVTFLSINFLVLIILLWIFLHNGTITWMLRTRNFSVLATSFPTFYLKIVILLIEIAPPNPMWRLTCNPKYRPTCSTPCVYHIPSWIRAHGSLLWFYANKLFVAKVGTPSIPFARNCFPCWYFAGWWSSWTR